MCHYIKEYKIFFCVLDTAIFSLYTLYKKITKQQKKYNQFWEMIAEQFIEEAEMPSYARRGRPFADSDMRLQAVYWAHLLWQIPSTQGNSIPKKAV